MRKCSFIRLAVGQVAPPRQRTLEHLNDRIDERVLSYRDDVVAPDDREHIDELCDMNRNEWVNHMSIDLHEAEREFVERMWDAGTTCDPIVLDFMSERGYEICGFRPPEYNDYMVELRHAPGHDGYPVLGGNVVYATRTMAAEYLRNGWNTLILREAM